MIARLRTWLDRSGPTPAADLTTARDFNDLVASMHAAAQARIAELEKQLSTERMTTAALDVEVKRLVRQNNVINLRADAAIAEATRLRADHTYVTAERCECGGDTELYWRLQAAAAETRAARDRANAVRLTDELERVVHIAEQLERSR